MIASTQDLVAWLEQRAGQTLYIDKEEDGDRDRVRLFLERVEKTERQEVADAYTPRRTVLLRGEGEIHNPGEEPVPLPGQAYEIVLDGLVSHMENAGTLVIKTTRAAYRIQ
jgi:hypothetical protein